MQKKPKKEKNNAPVLSKDAEEQLPQLEATPLKYGKDDQGRSVVSVAYSASDGKSKKSYDERLKEVIGVKDTELANSILKKGARAIEASYPNQSNNIVLQTLNNLQAKDVIEARLITQETALYSEVMNSLQHLNNSEGVGTAEMYLNMASKLVRLHNETIETLSRYKRGGSQTVNVQHTVVDNRAVVNNFGVGGTIENKGDIPCSANCVVQKHEPIAISHVGNQQCLMGVADCMEESVLAQKQRKGNGMSN